MRAEVTDQLAIVDLQAEVKLTERQQRVLDLVKTAGPDGVHADEVGALLHEQKRNELYRHGRDERCQFCGHDGKALLEALKAKGLVRYRRAKEGVPGAWLPAGKVERPHPRGMLRDDEPIGF